MNKISFVIDEEPVAKHAQLEACVKHLSGAPLYGSLLVLPTNIGLGWKSLLVDKH